MPIRLAVVWLHNTTARRMAYTGIYRHTAYKKTAPEDGLIQSETCTAYIENKA